MDEFRNTSDEQLNTASEDAEFTLDDILEEFGQPEDTPVREDEEIKIWKPQEKATPVSDEPTVKLPPVEDVLPAEEEDDEEFEEEEEEYEAVRPVFRFRRFKTEPQQPELPAPEELLARYEQQRRRLTLPTVLAWILLVLTAAVSVVAANPQWSFSAMVPMPVYAMVSTGILLLHAVLALRVLSRGLQDVFGRKFTAATLLDFATLTTVIDGFLCLRSGRMPLCAAGSLLLTVALWSDRLLLTAKVRTLRAALAMENPMAAARYENTWNGMDGLYRRPADLDRLSEDLESEPAPTKALRVIAPILAAVTLTVALFAAIKGGHDFLWAWSALLLTVCPVGGLLAFNRTYCKITSALIRGGAVITGWRGAKELCGNACVVITDSDLFAGNALTMNGIKIFGDYNTETLLAYATALLEQAGAGSASLFAETLEAQNGRRLRAENFRLYDVGGMGADFAGRVVLLGSRNFMRIMGVYMTKETNIPDALYLSVSGEVAAVFAVTYKTSEAVRSGLYALLGSRGLSPVLATRDILLNPETVERKYSLPKERLEYPVSKERTALNQAADEHSGEQGALMARSSFLSFALAIAGARYLRRRTLLALMLSVLGALLGLGVMTLLVLLGAVEAVSAMNLLIFHVLWLIPVGLLTR